MERWKLRWWLLGLGYRTGDSNSLQTFGEEKNCTRYHKFHINPPPPGGEKPLPRYQEGKTDQSRNPNMNRDSAGICAVAKGLGSALEGSWAARVEGRGMRGDGGNAG